MIPQRLALLACVLAACLVAPSIACGQEEAEHDPVADAQQALEGFGDVVNRALEDFNVPGAAIAVVAGGEVVYAEGFGFRDVESGKPMTPNTLFAIGSTTKAMTATALGMLVDEGKLDWDQPLRSYLPTFRLSDPMITERITPRDMLTHRSGLPRHDMIWYNNNESTRAEIVSRLAHLELSADLRERFQYNNLMYMTAGYLTGLLEGKDWEDVIRERLFEPLGMERSNFSVHESQEDDDFAYPYQENDDHEIERIPFRVIDLMAPAGAVNSSVNEMSKWLLFNLNEGRVGDRQLINPTTLADIQSPHMTTGITRERPEVSQPIYGMGWSINTYRGHHRVVHGGSIDGFITSVVLFPDDELGLVSFNNGQSEISDLIVNHAADRILGLEPIDWLGEAKEKREKALEVEEEAKEKKEATRIPGTQPSHPLAAYAGEYYDAGYGTLKMDVAGDSLKVTYNGIVAPLKHWHYDVWNGAQTEGDETFENSKFIFRGDVDGNIAAVESAFEPRTAPIVFEKRADPRLSDPDYLRRFVGKYKTADETEISVALSGGVLTASIPGAPVLTLEPDLSGRFVLREVRTVSLEFVIEGDEATRLLIHQPSSIQEAERVE